MSLQHNQEMVVIGRFGRPVGIHGEIKLFAFSRDPDNIASYRPWYIKDTKGQWQVIDCNKVNRRDKFLQVSIDGISNREQAKSLTNKEIAIAREVLPKLAQGEYYWQELVGLNVINTLGHTLGDVSDLIETGSNDVLVVKSVQKEHLIPFLLEDFILEIDLANKKIMVDWDEDF